MVTERAQTAPSRNGTRTAVLLLGHGSRARGATAAVARVAAEVRERTHFIVAVGFTEYEQPSIDDGFDECVRQGAAEILVVPYFLHMGNHVRRDLPERIAAGQQRYPHVKVVHGPPIGYHPALVDILLERVAETASLAGSRESECGGVRVQALPYPFTAPALPAGKAIEEKSF